MISVSYQKWFRIWQTCYIVLNILETIWLIWSSWIASGCAGRVDVFGVKSGAVVRCVHVSHKYLWKLYDSISSLSYRLNIQSRIGSLALVREGQYCVGLAVSSCRGLLATEVTIATPRWFVYGFIHHRGVYWY